MTEIVSIERDGPDAARAELERCVGEGGVAIFPADTLYGLACDPLNEHAVDRVRSIKGRDGGKPSAVMYFSPLAMRELVAGLGDRSRQAVSELLPGPVTLVIANPERRYPLASRGSPETLGVRLIAGPLAGTMTPILQTSANPSGVPAPKSFEEIDGEVLGATDVAIDGGELIGAPSTVIDLTELDSSGRWEVLREGALPRGVIDRILGETARP
jgi:L-threonylcarbamoyladenylate synthase